MEITLGPDTVLRLAGLVGAIIFLSTAAIKFYRFIDRAEDTWRTVTAIAAETSPNGGDSLRDAIDTTRENVAELIGIAAENKQDIERLNDRVDRLDTRVESVNGWLFAQHLSHEAVSRDPSTRTRSTDKEREN